VDIVKKDNQLVNSVNPINFTAPLKNNVSNVLKALILYLKATKAAFKCSHVLQMTMSLNSLNVKTILEQNTTNENYLKSVKMTK